MFEQVLDQGARGGTDRLRPSQQAARGPLEVALMRFGHMLGQRGMTALAGAAAMSGDALAVTKDFDGGGGEAHVHRLAHEARRDTIEVAFDFEMIIKMDTGVAPLGVLVGDGGQGFERGLVRGEELGVPRARQFLEGDPTFWKLDPCFWCRRPTDHVAPESVIISIQKTQLSNWRGSGKTVTNLNQTINGRRRTADRLAMTT